MCIFSFFINFENKRENLISDCSGLMFLSSLSNLEKVHINLG